MTVAFLSSISLPSGVFARRDQEERPGRAEALDVGRAALLELEPVGGETAERLAHVDAARLAVRFHARGGIHGVAPDIVGEARIADDARCRRTAMDADPHPQLVAAERRLLADQLHHCKRKPAHGGGALHGTAAEAG